MAGAVIRAQGVVTPGARADVYNNPVRRIQVTTPDGNLLETCLVLGVSFTANVRRRARIVKYPIIKAIPLLDGEVFFLQRKWRDGAPFRTEEFR